MPSWQGSRRPAGLPPLQALVLARCGSWEWRRHGAGAPAGSRGHPSHVLPINCPRPGRGQPQGAPSRVLAVCQHRPLRCGVSRRPQERSPGGTGGGGV